MIISNFIYYFIGISAALAVFEIVWLTVLNGRLHRNTIRISYYNRLIAREEEHIISSGSASKRHISRMSRELESIAALRCWQIAISSHKWKSETIRKTYMRDFSAVYIFLAIEAKGSRNSMRRAIVADAISESMVSFGSKSLDVIAGTMFDFLSDRSVFCRANAMNALYHMGDAQLVASAIEFLGRGGLFYHPMLLTDGLSGFSGDIDVLGEALYSSLKKFAPRERAAVIDYLSEHPSKEDIAILEMMDDPNGDDRVRAAAVRYFGKNLSDDAKKLMLEYVSPTGSAPDAVAEESASALSEYSGADVLEALTGALYHENHTVAERAARSIAGMDITDQEYLAIMTGSSRIARDLLRYTMTDTREEAG